MLCYFYLFSFSQLIQYFIYFQMKYVATENFQKIRDAYEILTDEQKRLIYDIYGMEGLKSGLELGPKLSKPDEIKEELERLQRRKEQAKVLSHARPTGALIANLSLPRFLNGEGMMRGYMFILHFGAIELPSTLEHIFHIFLLFLFLFFDINFFGKVQVIKCTMIISLFHASFRFYTNLLLQFVVIGKLLAIDIL